jgi:hypothetical protein
MLKTHRTRDPKTRVRVLEKYAPLECSGGLTGGRCVLSRLNAPLRPVIRVIIAAFAIRGTLVAAP